jgi:hypothetical protein
VTSKFFFHHEFHLFTQKNFPLEKKCGGGGGGGVEKFLSAFTFDFGLQFVRAEKLLINVGKTTFLPPFKSIISPLFYVNCVNHHTHSNIHTQFLLSREARFFFETH